MPFIENGAEDLLKRLLPGWLTEALAQTPHELIVCYDFDEDSTLPALAAMPDRPPTVRLVRNSFGKGVANALIAGFARTHPR
jgi:dolichol-phosphate mannosyltransferase